MPSETCFCPHCKRSLTKSAQTYVMGEMLTDKDANFMLFGDPTTSKPVHCPSCGGLIDAQKMMRGEYDADPNATGRGAGCVMALIAAAVFAVIVFPLDQSWWIGLIAAILTMGILDSIYKALRKQK